MLTKNAIGNLLNRYRAVLKTCHLANTFGSLALAGAALLSVTTVAQAADVTTPYLSGDGWAIIETQAGQNADFTVGGKGYIIDITGTSDTMAVATDEDGNKNINGSFLEQKQKDVAPIKDGNGSITTESITYTVYGGAVRLFCDGENTVLVNPPFQQIKVVNGQTNIDINNITGAFVGNSADKLYREYDIQDGKYSYATDGHFAMGGALFNQRNIESITADFIGNSVSTEDSYYEDGHGGAIMHMYGHIGSITGDFIANTADGTGGAIRMSHTDDLSYRKQHLGVGYHNGSSDDYALDPVPQSATVGTITGDFIGNSATGGQGGAIYAQYVPEEGVTIERIEGDFKENSALGGGGALYLTSASVGSIKGDFEGNTVQDDQGWMYADGGAIALASGEIGSIEGNFTDNNTTVTNASTRGGALYVYGFIDSIQGNFTNNSAISNVDKSTLEFPEASEALGGAISLGDGGMVISITGNFTGNHAEGAFANGGAIHARAEMGSIESIKGDFTGNYVVGQNEARGGALSLENYTPHYGEFGGIEGNFTNNYAKAGDGGTAQGGAAFIRGFATFRANDVSNTFSGNYILENDGSKHYNAIFVEGGEVGFVMQGSGGFVMNDTIEGGGYDIRIQGEDADKNIFALNNAISDVGAIYLQDTTLRLGTATHEGVEYKGNIGGVESSLSGTNFILTERVKLENDLTSSNGRTIVVGADGIPDDWSSPTPMPNAHVTFTDGKTVSVETGGSLIVAGGLLDIANGTLKADIDPSDDPTSPNYDEHYDPEHPPVFQTSGNGSLRAEASNFGTFDLANGTFTKGVILKKDITNDGNLTLTGLSGTVSLENYKNYLVTPCLVDNGTLTLEGVTIVDGSGNPYVFEMNDLPDGFGQDVTAKAGKIGSYGDGHNQFKNIRIQSIAQGNTEADKAVVSHGSTLTLTGGGEGVTDALFSDNEDIRNDGTLYIGFRNEGTLDGNLDTILVTLDDGTKVSSETHVLADLTVTGNVSNSGITTFYDKAHIQGNVTTKPSKEIEDATHFLKETTIDGSLIIGGGYATFKDNATIGKVEFANNGYGEVRFEGNTDIGTIELKNSDGGRSSQVIFFADSTVDTMTVQSGDVFIYGATDETGRLTGEPCTLTVGDLTLTNTGVVRVNHVSNTHLKVTGDLTVNVDRQNNGFLSVGYDGQLTASADNFGTFDLVNGTFDNAGASVVLGIWNDSGREYYYVGIDGNLTLTGLTGDMTLEAYNTLLEDAKNDYLIEHGTLTLAGVTIDGVGEGSGEGEGEDEGGQDPVPALSLDNIADGFGQDETAATGTLAAGKNVQIAGITGEDTSLIEEGARITLTGGADAQGILAEADLDNQGELILGVDSLAAGTLQGTLFNGGTATAKTALLIEGDLRNSKSMTFEKEVSVNGKTEIIQAIQGVTAGTITFNGKATLADVANYGTMTFADMATISGATTSSGALDFAKDASLQSLTVSGGTTTFNGNIAIKGATTVDGGSLVLNGNDWTASQAITVKNGTLALQKGTLDVSDSTFSVASGATLTTADASTLVLNKDDIGYDANNLYDETKAGIAKGATVTNEGLVKIEGFKDQQINYSNGDYSNLLANAQAHIDGGEIEFVDLTIDMGSSDLSDVAKKNDTSLGEVTVKGGKVEKDQKATVAGVTGENETTNEGALILTGKTNKNGGEGTLAQGEINNKGTMILGSEDTAARAEKKITNTAGATTTTKGTITLGEVENHGKLNVEGLATVTTLTATSGASVNIGNLDTKGILISANTVLNGASIFSDPAWVDGVAIEGASCASLGFDDAKVDGLVTVGQNSYVVLGSGTVGELGDVEDLFANEAYGLTWGENDITAALFLNKAYEVDSTKGGIMVDGILTTASTTGFATANSATFAAKSLLAVDADDLASSTATAALTAGTITANDGASLLIISKGLTYGADGKATVTIADADTTLEVADGAWGYDKDDTTVIDTSTIYVNSALMEVASVALDDTDKTYSVTVSKVSSADAFGGMMDDDLGTHIQNNDGTNAFLNNALALGTKDANKSATAIEGATKTAVTSGVGTALGQIGSAGVANIQTRTGSTTAFSENDTRNMLAMTGDGAVLPVDTAQEGLGLWFMPMYKHTSADGFESGSYNYGYDTNLYGATLGADYTFASSLRLGLAFNVGSGESESTGDFDKTENDFDYFGLTAYGSMNFGKLAVSADLGYTASSNDINQDNAAGALTADADADLMSAGIKGEYKLGFDSFNITPYAGVRVNYYNVDSFNTKHQGTTTVHTDSSDYTIVEFPVGLTLDTTMQSSGWDITPSLGLGVKFAAGDLDMDQKINYIGADGSAVLSSEIADAVTFQGALGLGLSKDAYSIDLGYTLDLSNNVESHGLKLNLRYEF